jgi:hypothetical protein
MPAGVSLRDLGWHRLKDIEAPERIYQLVASGLEERFPPLKSLGASGWSAAAPPEPPGNRGSAPPTPCRRRLSAGRRRAGMGQAARPFGIHVFNSFRAPGWLFTCQAWVR